MNLMKKGSLSFLAHLRPHELEKLTRGYDSVIASAGPADLSHGFCAPSMSLQELSTLATLRLSIWSLVSSHDIGVTHSRPIWNRLGLAGVSSYLSENFAASNEQDAA